MGVDLVRELLGFLFYTVIPIGECQSEIWGTDWSWLGCTIHWLRWEPGCSIGSARLGSHQFISEPGLGADQAEQSFSTPCVWTGSGDRYDWV